MKRIVLRLSSHKRAHRLFHYTLIAEYQEQQQETEANRKFPNGQNSFEMR